MDWLDELLPSIKEGKSGARMEIWKDIPEFEGVYQISTYGRVKSFKEYKEGRILSNVNKKGGYLSLILRYQSKKRCTRIHRLVAEAFIPNPDNIWPYAYQVQLRQEFPVAIRA